MKEIRQSWAIFLNIYILTKHYASDIMLILDSWAYWIFRCKSVNKKKFIKNAILNQNEILNWFGRGTARSKFGI